MLLSLLAAVSENNVIGRDGQLPWHLSDDLKRFKRQTMGHPILMGRKTWDSIGGPLPGRTSIVISRQANFSTGHEEVRVAGNLDDALAFARGLESAPDETFVIGGARIYEMCMPRADRLLLTRVHAEVEGDVWFPEIDWQQWELIEEEKHARDEKNDYAHTFQVWQRS